VEIDGTVLAFTFGVSLLTSLVFGAAPALHAARTDLAAMMKSLGKSSATRTGVSTRDVLVVAQVALSVVLLVGAGLLVRSLWRLQDVKTGFDPSGLVAGSVSLPPTKYTNRDAEVRFWDQLFERVRAIPGVESVAATTLFPLRGGGDTYFYIDGRPPATDADKMNATVSSVTEDYFTTMRIPLISGRVFNASDRAGAGVMIVSDALARRLFPGASALGKRLVVDFGKPFVGEIVGVVGDVRIYGQANDAPEVMYFASRQPNAGWGMGFGNLATRVRGDPEAVASQLRAAVRALDPDVPLSAIQSVESILYDSVAAPRFRTQLLVGFAAVALILAVVGLYGMLAYSVTQRSREMGIRLALGARPTAVFRMVIRQGMALVVVGIVLGVAGAFAATRLLAAQLFTVRATDPMVFGCVAITLAVAGLAACIVPARRATKADPISALRME
jgi:putative ABC transport system permease protein